MLEEKQEITDAIDAAMELIGQHNRSEVIPYATIQSHCNMDREHPSWNAFVVRLRKRLQAEHNLVIRFVHNVGMQLLTDEDAVKRCAKEREKKRYSQAKKAKGEISTADMSKLPVHLQRLKVMELDRLDAAMKEGRKAIKNISQSSKTETLPRRPLI